MLILISDSFDSSLPERLSAFGEVTHDKSRLGEAEVVLIRSKTKCDRTWIDSAPNVKLIIRGGVGLDNVDRIYAKERGITVTNTPEASSVAVAEMALSLMLAAINHLVPAHQGMVNGQWLKKELKRTELFQKTLGLLGMGRIASEVSIRARAFGMRVVAYDPYVKESPHALMLSFDQVLAQSDFLSLHMPLTDETKEMLRAESIAKMKRGVIVINTGRGKCVREADMVEALSSGQVGFYATDVYTSDPPPPECPLLKAKNVLLIPHLGAETRENLLRIGDIVVEKIRAYVK